MTGTLESKVQASARSRSDLPGVRKALIVDDDPVNRKLLKAILLKENYDPILAENGQEAVEAFKLERPDLVLMDIMMPVMNGYEAARQIKDLSGERFTPIIFLTAVTDESALSRCVESGGDDFLTKPYNRIILKAKISALERIRGLYSTLHEQRVELEAYRSDIQHELEFAEHIFKNITSKGSLDLSYLQFWSSSMSTSMFNGDLVLAAKKPSGGVHLLLCDFTGHGLPAAVGALPVAEVFVAMTDRGFGVADIVMEMNLKLKTELPTGFFCAAALVDVDATRCTLSIWNGGLPEILVVDESSSIKKRVTSNHLPLGITDKVVNNTDLAVMDITRGMRLFMYTDGVIEAVNPEGEMFGSERLCQVVEGSGSAGSIFADVQSVLDKFRGGTEQSDDISLVDLDCYRAMNDLPGEALPSGHQGIIPAEWKLNFELSAGILRDLSPVPVVLNMLTQIRVPGEHRRRVYTVLSELVNNAVDHGLLQLRSELKSTPEGFAAYYLERQKRLAAMDEGCVNVYIGQEAAAEGYLLRIRVADSGPGFDVDEQLLTSDEPPDRNSRPSGRGIALIRSICQELVYSDQGRTAEAVYLLSEKTD